MSDHNVTKLPVVSELERTAVSAYSRFLFTGMQRCQSKGDLEALFAQTTEMLAAFMVAAVTDMARVGSREELLSLMINEIHDSATEMMGLK